MSDDVKECENCVNKLMFAKDMDHLSIIVEGHTELLDKLDIRLSKLERRSDVTDERFNQVFQKLDEIIGILKERENRLPNLAYSIAGMVIGGVCSGVIMWLVAN